MESDELRLHLIGTEGRMDARALYSALGSFLGLLRDTNVPDAAYVISELKIGSLEVGVRPAGVVGHEDLERLLDVSSGIDALERASGIPPAWDDRRLTLLIEIARVTKYAGVEGVELLRFRRAPVRLDLDVLRHAEESLSAKRFSLGSVRGKLDRYNHRGNRREVGLLDEVSGRAVRVTFPDRLNDKVKDALDQPVLAWGKVWRNEQGDKVSLELDDFEVLGAGPETGSVSLEDLSGSWSSFATDADPVDAVRRQRES